MENKHHVFVYGTLRRHESNHRLLKDAECISQQAYTRGILFDTGLGYPAMVESETGTVYGEVYLVTAEQLQRLDELEGYHGPGRNNLYERKTQKIYFDNGTTDALLYVLEERLMHRTPIESGDWKWHQFNQNRRPLIYFAYGSCMDDVRFKKAKKNHFFQDIRGCGILKGYSLRFTRKSSDGGKADIVEIGGVTEGKVYAVIPDCLEYLFRREGVNSLCYRPTFVDIEVNGGILEDVLTFTVVNKEKETAPFADYLEEILRGGAGLLSEEYLESLKQQLKQTFGLVI